LALGSRASQTPAASETTSGAATASAAASESAAAAGTLQLYVSNQSFDDETVRIRVTVDGAEVVDQRFDVGSQHNWITFPLTLPAGTRRIEAVSDTGVTLSETVTIPASGTHYAVIDYWDDSNEPRKLTFHDSSEPIGFA
jgi:hypothetical protein